MSVIVKTPDGKIHTFPDGTTPAQIKAAIPSPAAVAAPREAAVGAGRRIARALLPPIGGIAGGVAGGLLTRSAQGVRLGWALGSGAELAGAGLGGAAARWAAGGGSPLAEGFKQAGEQSLGVGAGLIGRAAGGTARILRRSAVGRAVKEARRAEAVKDVADVAAAEKATAVAARQAGGQATRAALGAAGPIKITLAEVADRVLADMPIKSNPQMRRQLINDLRELVSDVRKSESLGLIDERRLVFAPVEADQVLRGLQAAAKPTWQAAERGARPQPKLAASAATELRKLLDERVPGFGTSKKATQEAILDVQAVRRQPRPVERRIALARRERGAAERAGRIGQPVHAYLGAGPRFLGTGFSIDPMSSADVLARLLGDAGVADPGRLARVAPWLAGGMRALPRGFALADELSREE